MSNAPIARISIRRKEGDSWRSYSVLSAWPTKFDGLVNVTLDRGSEKYPAMGLLDAIKAVAAGASIEVRTTMPRSGNGGSRQSSDSGYQSGGFDDGGDLPF